MPLGKQSYDPLEYLRELKLWGYAEEADRKLSLIAENIDNPLQLEEIFEEWTYERKFDWFGSYYGRFH